MNTEINKALVAAVMAILILIDQAWSLNIGPITEESVTIVLAILTPLLVWWVPNKPAQNVPNFKR